MSNIDVHTIRQDFPILSELVNGKPLVYFDNAATSQKPIQVIKKLEEYYTLTNSNIHRGAHYLAEKATEEYEQARTAIKDFINANSSVEINFTKGTTDAINLVANSYGQAFVKKDDEILISEMEHHSNIVPWQMLCDRTGAKLKVIPIHDTGELDIDAFEQLLSEKTKLVSISYISNALGTINPVKHIIEKAHQVNAVVLLDAAQAAPHTAIDVQELDCDFIAFSSHKMFGPTGMGILYGKEALLEKMPPYIGGGEMIKEVSFEGTTYNDLPYKFEAGTPNIAGGIAFGEAINYINDIGIETIKKMEAELLSYATIELEKIDGLKIIGQAKNKASVASFLVDGVHPFDMGVLLDKMGIAIRTGHHCCQPLMKRLDIEGTCRASFSFYNTKEEIDKLIVGINRIKQIV